MKKLLFLIALVPAFVLGNPTPQTATEVEKLMKPNSKTLRLIEAIKVSPKVLTRKLSSDGNIQVVFVYEGNRYTIFCSESDLSVIEEKVAIATKERKNISSPFISFWVRPNGTTSPEQVQTFSDHWLDGFVDFGARSQKNSGKEYYMSDRVEELAQWKEAAERDPKYRDQADFYASLDDSHQQSFQDQLEAALKASYKHFGIK